MTTFRTAFAASALAAAALAGFASPALAAPAGQVHTVSYSDLDLTDADGRATLDARLRTAARAVCDIGTDRQPLAQDRVQQTCFKKALGSARAEVASRSQATKVAVAVR